MEGVCAVELRNLAEMPEVVGGTFVEHLRERDGAKLGMHGGTRTGGRRKTLQ
jgi:hypothetical protein